MENEIIGERLEASPFAVREGTGLFPMIDMRSAAAGARDGVRRFRGIQPTVNLADSRAMHLKLEVGTFFQERGVEDVLPFPDEFQPLDDPRRHLRELVVRGIWSDGRVLDGFPARRVEFGRRCRRHRRMEGKRRSAPCLLVLTDSHNYYSVPRLRDAIFLELVEMGIYKIPRILHVLQDGLERCAVIRARDAADILRKKPERLVASQDADAVGIERTVLAVEPLLLADEGEIIAREAESEGVEWMLGKERVMLDIQFMDILAEDAVRVLRADIRPIGFTSRWVDIVRPRMRNGELRMTVDMCLYCAAGDAAWSTKKLAKMEVLLQKESAPICF